MSIKKAQRQAHVPLVDFVPDILNAELPGVGYAELLDEPANTAKKEQDNKGNGQQPKNAERINGKSRAQERPKGY